MGIESSCDETSVAVVRDGREVLSNIVSSQVEIHRLSGGVIPEIASRRHVKNIVLIIEKALQEANCNLSDLDAIAVTQGPGLVGALLIGIEAAKTLALCSGLPLVGVHHTTGHIYANHLTAPLQFPLVSLVVSGGHTNLIYMPEHNRYQLLGQTLDDAVGEAFDKVARMMGLPYPGGPHIDKLSREGVPRYNLPRAWLKSDSLDFSFSGLKTAVRILWEKAEANGEPLKIEDVAASFQEAAVDVLVEKTIRAVKRMKVDYLVLAGGVAANMRLRELLEMRCADENIRLSLPELQYCGDNAAMIAAVGAFELAEGRLADFSLSAEANLKLTSI